MPSTHAAELRQMLAEKFPGVRMHLPGPSLTQPFWPTGIAALDTPLQGGLPKGALTEIVSRREDFGGGTLLHGLLHQAARENRITALIDASDSFAVTQMAEAVLARLLWIRNPSVEKALKAADLILRDGNLSLVLLDLKMVNDRALRKIPATTWYRLQRLVENSTTVCVIFTPRLMIAPAKAQVILHSRCSLTGLEAGRTGLIGEFKVSVPDAGPMPGKPA